MKTREKNQTNKKKNSHEMIIPHDLQFQIQPRYVSKPEKSTRGIEWRSYFDRLVVVIYGKTTPWGDGKFEVSGLPNS